MIVPRSALERVISEHKSELSYRDDDGRERVAIFSQMFVGEGARSWLGEDYSFCERLRASDIEISAPVEGKSIHDGIMLDLHDAAALP